MKKRTAILPAAAAVFVLGAAAPNADARSNPELVAHAHRILDIADDLAHEFRVHYRHTDEYCHLNSDIARIRAEARHIDSLAHDYHASLRHIRADVQDLDKAAHHLHDVVDRLERHARHHRGHGHIDGDTRHVHRLLSSLNSAIHSMERTIDHSLDFRCGNVHRDIHRADVHRGGYQADVHRGGHRSQRLQHGGYDRHDPARVIGSLIWALSR